MKAFYNDNTGIFQYNVYDDKGERTIKYGLIAPADLYQNGVLMDPDALKMQEYKLYPNPYITVSSTGQYTKHYFEGSKRFASRVIDGSDIFTQPPSTTKVAAQSETKENANPEADFKTYLEKTGLGNDVSVELREQYQHTGLYYLHGDHLGTATFVTNFMGDPTQFFLNLPFGETMLEQTDGTYNNPYKFNAKELDEDIGLYYYGARYYNPRLSIWYGVDPLAEKYPSWSPYVYTFDNPINFIDPDGKEGIVVSGQPGPHKNREHFLVNGLDRAKGALKHRQSPTEKVTWMVYNDGSKKYGYSKETLAKYEKLAKKAGITMKVVNDTDQIVDYVNNKNGGSSREKDKITSFYYVGHATPGDLDAGYTGGLGGQDFDADDLKGSAFAKGAWVNVTAACRTAEGGWIEDSVVDQFVEKLDKTSTVNGSNVRTQFDGGKRTDAQLLEANKGKQITKKGKK